MKFWEMLTAITEPSAENVTAARPFGLGGVPFVRHARAAAAADASALFAAGRSIPAAAAGFSSGASSAGFSSAGAGFVGSVSSAAAAVLPSFSGLSDPLLLLLFLPLFDLPPLGTIGLALFVGLSTGKLSTLKALSERLVLLGVSEPEGVTEFVLALFTVDSAASSWAKAARLDSLGLKIKT